MGKEDVNVKYLGKKNNFGNVTYQIVKVVETYEGDFQETILNNALGEVLEIPELQYALEMVAMLNENSGSGIKYKLRGINNK